MPLVPIPLPSRQIGVAVVAALCIWAAGVQAQGTSAGVDHLLVVTRTVQSRIAYRGIPLEDNPVRVQATTFPGSVFHQTIDTAVERLVGDDDLLLLGSAGLDRSATMRFGSAGTTSSMLGGMGAAGATPLGVGARAGGVVSAATSRLDSVVNGSLLPPLGTSGGGR